MGSVRYEHALSSLKKLQMLDDSAERKQNLTSPYQQFYCQFSDCFRMQFPEIDFQFYFIHLYS